MNGFERMICIIILPAEAGRSCDTLLFIIYYHAQQSFNLIYILLYTSYELRKAIGSDTNKQNDQLLLGPFKNDPATKKPLEYSTECSGGYGSWFAKSYYAPSYASTFTVSQKCEYLYRTPTTGTCTWCIPVICYVMLCLRNNIVFLCI